VPPKSNLMRIEGGYFLEVQLSDGEFGAILPTDDKAVLRAGPWETKGQIMCGVKRGAQQQIIRLED